jgi:radical SAM superfamily enzyme YgiQ (UPF0313 family)
LELDSSCFSESRKLQLDPNQPLRCLLIQPKFEETNFWNFVEGAHAIGARATAPPLGLLTVAALLPQNWQFKLVDLNVRPLRDEDWQWAQIICTGGMLPQQAGILEVVARANADQKYVVIGGPDPTSQPELYASASAIVTGEGESSIPIWLKSWKAGQPNGTFIPDQTVDVTKTPLPRFELINFNNYLNAGIQSSRGCPYNCEFCDVIELFGRKPRVKEPAQFVRELQNLYDAGYRGWVDIHDDNFIGNRLKIKPVLEAAAVWMKEHKYPFVLSTEASVNLADDDELLELMRECQFRYVFLGIETPDPEVLKQTQKRINTVRPLVERIRKLYESGISVTAGFILGFDSEPENVDQSLVPFIQECGISMAMVGLLFAMPNTQLTRRLKKEGRLISHRDGWTPDLSERYNVRVEKGVDHTGTGLNFVTMRDRVDIYRELRTIINAIYSPQAFMDRVLDTTQRLNFKTRHMPGWWEGKRMIRGFFNVSWSLLKRRETRWLYLRNAWKSLWMGIDKFEYAHTTMGGYSHFKRQSDVLVESLSESIKYFTHNSPFPRSVADIQGWNGESKELADVK